MKKLTTAIAAVCAAMCMAACTTKEYAVGDDLHGAWAYAQIYVEENLNRKVEFEYGAVAHGAVRHIGNDEYDVISYAVATGEYGAKKRIPFHVRVSRIDSGRKWRVVDIRS